MFRRLFRIGFGGCGCALEEHFRNHAVELARELLLKCYVEKLKKWDDMLSLDKFEMANVGELKSNLKESMFNDETFNDQLKEIKNELDSWDKSLDRAKKSTGMSYEEDIIIELRSIITEMGNEVKKIKNKGSILLESLPVDTYTGSEEKDKRIYLYNQEITETRDLIVDQYEHAVIESEGFNHQPELQMLPFSIHEVRNEVYSNLKKKISKDKLLENASRGYLFFVGLGGGTGTGVISPLAERFGKGSQGYFTLGVLGGKNDGDSLSESQKPWFRRCFNMLLALNDLMVTADLDGIILLDNEVVIKRLEDRRTEVNAKEIDNEIIRVLYPAFGVTALENKENKLDWAQLRGPIGLNVLERKPPVFVPCYASGDGNLEDLIGDALTKGMLANYKYKSDNGDRPVEKVFVYTRCIEDEDAVEEKLRDLFGKKEDIAIIKEYLFCWDDIAKENYKEFRRFVGDYYDITWANAATASPDKLVNTLKISKNPDVYIKIQTDYLFNWDSVLKGENKEELESYLRDGLKIEWADRLNPKISKDKKTISIVKDNENKVEIMLDDDDKKATLTMSEGESLDLQVKRKKGNRIIYQPSNAKLIYSKNKDNPTDIDVKTVNNKDYIYLKGGPATRDWLLRKLENKTVVVFESQEIGTYWKVRALIEKSKVERKECEVNHEIIRNFKKNEVLILLVNPNIKDVLYDRLQEANKFVGLLDKLKELIDKRGAGSTDKSRIADDIINGSIQDTEIDKILNDISTVGIDKTIKEPKKEILAEAKAFLLPKELIEKNENIYEHMKKILKRLTSEAENACNNLEKGTWPIFREKIFDITSISGKRDEVILSSISAMNTEDEFKRLVGDAYGTYSKSFQRQFFKYHTHYLYPGSGADHILRDEAEEKLLPEELKNAIDKKDERIKGDDLEELVKEHMDKLVPLFSFSIDTKHLAQLGNGSVSNELKKEFEENKITLSKNSVWIKGTYLFSWDRIPGQDKMKFLQFLNNDRDFDWVKYATISKSPDLKSISVIGNNSDEKIELTIENTTLKINNGKKCDIKIETVNDKQYMYKETDTERTIIDGADIYVIKEESTKLNVYAPAKISFPTMLALAGLYAKWQYLFSWPPTYSFNWDNILYDKSPSNDKEKLRSFLKNDLGIEWAKDANIHKNSNGNMICIKKDSHSATITIGDGKSKAILKIENGDSHNLEVKEEDGKRNIYTTIDKKKLKEKLFKNPTSESSNDFEICPLFSIHPKFENELNDSSSISGGLKEEFKKYGFSPADTPPEKTEEMEWVIFDSEKKEKFIIRKEEEKLNVYSEKKINLIINEKNEDATLIIRRSGSPLFTWKAGEDEYINLDEEIPKGLKDEFKNVLKVVLKEDKMIKEEEQWWKIPYETSYYYIQQVNPKELEIYGDEIHKLKVKKDEESGKFKIYKRRGEMFRVAEIGEE